MVTAARSDGAARLPVVVGDLWIDVDGRAAALAGRSLVLTPVEFELLLSLARATARVKSRERLLLEAGDRDFEGLDRSIDVHIAANWGTTHRDAGA